MKPPVSNHLFVYSFLRKGFHKTSYHYITQFFSFVCNAKVKGIVSDVQGKLFATLLRIIRLLKGELYKLNDEHDFSYAIGQLDDYEGLIVEQGEKPAYRRELTTVYKDDGEIANAWIYWFNGDVRGKSIATSGNIVDIAINNYLFKQKPVETGSHNHFKILKRILRRQNNGRYFGGNISVQETAATVLGTI